MNDEIKVVDWSGGVATAFCCAAAYNSDGHTHAACRTVVAHISDLRTRLLPPGGERHTEWGVVHESLGEFHRCSVYPNCHDWFPWVHNKRRSVTEWPDGSTFTTAWEAME